MRRGASGIRPARWAMTAFAAALAAGLALVAAGCGAEEKPSPPPSSPEGETPQEQVYDYLLVESKAGVKQWRLASQRMEKFAARRPIELYDLTMDFFDQGQYYSTLTADRGRANLDAKDLFAWGRVVVVTQDGRRLETEELRYDDGRRLIHNEVFNRLTWRGDVVTGYGLEATPDLKYVEIKERVRGGAQTRDGEAQP